MSRGNWGKRFAIGLGVLIALGLIVFSAYQYQAASDDQSQISLQADDKSEQEQYRAHTEVEGCSKSVAAPDDKVACETKAAQESQKTIREIRDLEAQQTMALWTRYMGIAAIIGITVGIIGMGLIFFTFWETRKAAVAGREANKIAQAAQRPWLRVEYPKTAILHNHHKTESRYSSVNVAVDVKNLGSAAAIRPSLQVALLDISDGYDSKEVVKRIVDPVREKRFCFRPVMPNDEAIFGERHTFHRPVKIGRTWRDAGPCEIENMALAIVVVYQSVGGEDVFFTGDIFWLRKQRKLKDNRTKVTLNTYHNMSEAT